jgi:hypothetical protein
MTRVGRRPEAVVVKIVRQLPLKLVVQPPAVAAGMWSAASKITPDRPEIAVRAEFEVAHVVPEHAVKLDVGIARM